ncbi:MAG: family 10 glycosylhydrolase [Prevotellaceae bacterium]|jgi:uncharacterized lipoprotein YddW (UPF0748 family)|nr:family 10 glycosylhydrolase [Prevotellaceae bacterium]
MIKKYLIVIILILNITVSFAQNKREMRAVWVATVANIDWSPKDVFDVYSQKKAMLRMLDTLESLKINALIFQVRPTADAFYYSEIELWSRFLTGTQGVAPTPFYDPLAFVVEEAHRRNIEVHIWLNPYRVLNANDTTLLSANHLFYKNRKLFIKYGDKYYFNPALQQTREHLVKVVADLVSRYDIQAVHLDDYFYPYPVSGEQFPDNEDFKNDPHGFTNKNDWRRDNVNLAISLLSDTIKKIKPWVEFGISPFGIWRNKSRDPKGSDTKALSNYDDLYADILLWLKEGKIDYVMPQLYWEIGHKSADYQTLAEWWSKNSFGKNLYIGLFASGLAQHTSSSAWRKGNELVRQLNLNKKYPKIQGVGLYSAVALMENRGGICDSLKNSFFKNYALVPENISTAEKTQAPENITVKKNSGRVWLYWDTPADSSANYFVVYFAEKKRPNINNSENILAVTHDNCIDITNFYYEKRQKDVRFILTSVNRYKKESEPSEMVKMK